MSFRWPSILMVGIISPLVIGAEKPVKIYYCDGSSFLPAKVRLDKRSLRMKVEIDANDQGAWNQSGSEGIATVVRVPFHWVPYEEYLLLRGPYSMYFGLKIELASKAVYLGFYRNGEYVSARQLPCRLVSESEEF